jgi:hypothetical protein
VAITKKRCRHRIGGAAQAHLAFGHDLQQCRLHLGWRPVHLVGQQQVHEHRAQLHVEGLARGPVDAGAHDVGRQQVGGELHPGKRAAHAPGQGLGGQCFGQTGHAFQQAMPTCHQAHHQAFQQPLLTHDGASHFEHDLLEQHRRVLGRHRLTEVN